MKKNVFTLALTLLTIFTSVDVTAQEKAINVAESNIHWLGKKVTGQHEGDISLKSGNLQLSEGTVTGGRFVVDMNSMTCTDLQGSSSDKLIGHLKSDDFFGVTNHSEATLVFTTVTPKSNGLYAVTGDFTIKGITHPATFDLKVDGNQATAKVIIDRTKYNIRYGSSSFIDNLGDKAIYDDFELDVILKM